MLKHLRFERLKEIDNFVDQPNKDLILKLTDDEIEYLKNKLGLFTDDEFPLTLKEFGTA